MDYYNDHDAFCCDWLRQLIHEKLLPYGIVDSRELCDVAAGDLVGFRRCHFFAGIGGWAYALELAGWDDRPIWTGSCPCQRFSSATRGRHTADDQWPSWRALIQAARPAIIVGEQVAAATTWMDGVCADLEAAAFTIRTVNLPAYSAGCDHARQRFYFAGYANSDRQSSCPIDAETPRLSWADRVSRGMESAYGVSPRMGQLRAFGNAIVPQVAAAFIQAAHESFTGSATTPITPTERTNN